MIIIMPGLAALANTVLRGSITAWSMFSPSPYGRFSMRAPSSEQLKIQPEYAHTSFGLCVAPASHYNLNMWTVTGQVLHRLHFWQKLILCAFSKIWMRTLRPNMRTLRHRMRALPKVCATLSKAVCFHQTQSLKTLKFSKHVPQAKIHTIIWGAHIFQKVCAHCATFNALTGD